VADAAPQHLREPRGKVVVGQDLRAGQVVGAALVAGLGQHLGGHVADVPGVDVRDASGGPCGGVEGSLSGDCLSLGELVLHEPVGAQEGPGDARLADHPLQRGVRGDEPDGVGVRSVGAGDRQVRVTFPSDRLCRAFVTRTLAWLRTVVPDTRRGANRRPTQAATFRSAARSLSGVGWVFRWCYARVRGHGHHEVRDRYCSCSMSVRCDPW
jgi:hypothetical protein